MDYSTLVNDSEAFARHLFTTFRDKEYPYHNLRHTTEVALHAAEIGGQCRLGSHGRAVVVIAAWFHDVGHLFGGMNGHEQVGALIMKNFLLNKDIPDEVVSLATGCIMATQVPTHPNNLHEMILCDADTYHFGTDYFRDTDTAMHKELEIRTGKTFPDWTRKSIRLLEEHQFYTEYCQQLLDEGKRRNLAWLYSRL